MTGMVPATALHAGDEVVIPVDLEPVLVTLTRLIHGSNGVSNIVIAWCEMSSGVVFVLGIRADLDGRAGGDAVLRPHPSHCGQ